MADPLEADFDRLCRAAAVVHDHNLDVEDGFAVPHLGLLSATVPVLHVPSSKLRFAKALVRRWAASGSNRGPAD